MTDNRRCGDKVIIRDRAAAIWVDLPNVVICETEQSQNVLRLPGFDHKSTVCLIYR